jgi:hypothetical protein
VCINLRLSLGCQTALLVFSAKLDKLTHVRTQDFAWKARFLPGESLPW